MTQDVRLPERLYIYKVADNIQVIDDVVTFDCCIPIRQLLSSILERHYFTYTIV